MIVKLQRFQNKAARLVLRRRSRDHVTPMLIHLHWLPVRARIDYKIAVLCFKCLKKTAPIYLQELIQPYIPSRSLRSASRSLLREPSTIARKLGRRAFSFYAPKMWNSLPEHLRDIDSISEKLFKKNLKTHLFKIHLLMNVGTCEP